MSQERQQIERLQEQLATVEELLGKAGAGGDQESLDLINKKLHRILGFQETISRKMDAWGPVISGMAKHLTETAANKPAGQQPAGA